MVITFLKAKFQRKYNGYPGNFERKTGKHLGATIFPLKQQI